MGPGGLCSESLGQHPHVTPTCPTRLPHALLCAMLPARLQFDITPDDFREAQNQHLWVGSPHASRTRWITIGGIGLILIGSGIIFSGRPIGGALVFGGMMLLIMQRLRIASSVRAFTRDQEKYRKLEIEISEEGLRIVTDVGQRSWKWPELNQALESEHLFMIYLDNKSFLAIPKRGMSAEQVIEIREALCTHLSRFIETTPQKLKKN